MGVVGFIKDVLKLLQHDLNKLLTTQISTKMISPIMRGSPKRGVYSFDSGGERQHFVIYNFREISYMNH